MPFYIVTKDGQLLLVETKVGEGLTQVNLVPVEQREPVDLEATEEQGS